MVGSVGKEVCGALPGKKTGPPDGEIVGKVGLCELGLDVLGIGEGLTEIVGSEVGRVGLEEGSWEGSALGRVGPRVEVGLMVGWEGFTEGSLVGQVGCKVGLVVWGPRTGKKTGR